jgi:hypothetical protein
MTARREILLGSPECRLLATPGSRANVGFREDDRMFMKGRRSAQAEL